MDKKDVPYLVYEASMTRLERIIEKLWIIVILLIILLVGSNGAWLYYESQFTDTVMTQEAEIDTRDGNAFVTNGGDLNYGESESEADY